jgi:hypothetical protein
MSSEVPSRAPVEVRRGQLWEFGINGTVRRARVVRVTVPINGVRYVYLKPLTNGRAMRVTLRQLQRGRLSRLVEDASPECFERKAPPSDEVVGRRKPSATVHEPRMSISDRRHAVARAHLLRARGMKVARIAKALCVMPEVVEIWLAEEPTEGTRPATPVQERALLLTPDSMKRNAKNAPRAARAEHTIITARKPAR